MRLIDEEYTFEWDSGNRSKSEDKHGVGPSEAESIFADPDKAIFEDKKHSIFENRYICVGKSNIGRVLTCYFTRRKDSIRIIGTRPASKKERNEYETKK